LWRRAGKKMRRWEGRKVGKKKHGK